ncbi:MAG: type II toxin-antitoxin system VapC family toxin [Pseudomonadota bacterium]|nr:type II toxin-antitoxin system VapC family toxin [Pseudomonadota bacterium]
MAALDTNVLVRYLVQDDPVQGELAARLIGRGVRARRSLFVPVSVLLELEWVLRSAFEFDKTAVLHTISRLIGSFELIFQAESAVEIALAQYEQGNADFADCLHAALAGDAGEEPLWTFDKAAAKVAGAKLLAS